MLVSGRRDVRIAWRDGMQTATWTYARVKTVPLAARASMLGVFICPNPYALISGRMSSMAIISTFRRAWAEAMDAQSNSVDSDMSRSVVALRLRGVLLGKREKIERTQEKRGRPREP